MGEDRLRERRRGDRIEKTARVGRREELGLIRLYAARGEQPRELARQLLAQAVGECFGCPRLPELAIRPGGKPFFPEREDISFSLSHSAGLALCAVGDAPLGCDIEALRPRRAALPRRTLSPEEWEWFSRRGARWEDFYLLWTRKEAAVKYTGRGLTLPPRCIRVPIPPETRGEGTWFWSWRGPGWAASLCAGGEAEPEPVELRWRRP